MGCPVNENIDNMTGYLIASSGGGKIYKIKPPIFSKQLVYESKLKMSNIQNLSKFTKDIIFFDEVSYPEGSFIKWLNYKSGISGTVLSSGGLPTYHQDTGIIFYYHTEHKAMWLMRAKVIYNNDQILLQDMKKISLPPPPFILKNGFSFHRTQPVIVTGKNNIAYLNQDGDIVIYNIYSDIEENVYKKGAVVINFMQGNQHLVCYNISDSYFFRLDLDTGIETKLDILYDMSLLGYVVHGDTLLYLKSRLRWIFHETHDLYQYSFSTGEKRKLFSDINYHSAIWVKEKRKGASII